MTAYKLFYLKDYEYDFDNELKLIINTWGKDKDIVIKVGETEDIKNEWQIIKNLKKYIPSGLPKYLSSPKKYNNKLVLLLPFYQYNSIKKAIWGMDNIEILKSLINQVFLNMFLNFHYFGLIYKNLDENCFDKILINEIDENTISYSYHSPYEKTKRVFLQETNGYQAVITDFEKCYYVHKKDGIIKYWQSIYNFIQHINTDLMVKMNNFKTILEFIETQIKIHGDYDNSIKLYNLLLYTKYNLIYGSPKDDIEESNEIVDNSNYTV